MIERDIMLTLILDYAPLMDANAIKVFLCYYVIKDEHNIADITFANLQEHLGMAFGTIKSMNDQLQDMGLIEIISRDTAEEPECYAPHRQRLIRVLPVIPMSMDARKRVFAAADKPVDSILRQQSLVANKLPLEYQRLLSKKDLKEAFPKLSKQNKFTVTGLVEHFQLDKDKVRLWLSNKEFKAALVRLMREIVEESSKEEVQQELAAVATKKQKYKKVRTANEMYDMLMSANLDRKTGTEKPIEQWGPSQLLRHFCVLYEKYNGSRYIIMPSKKNDFSGKELTDVTVVLRSFNNNAAEAAEYIEWVFEKKSSKLKDGVLGTGILRHMGMVNEYQRKKTQKTAQIRETDKIKEDFAEWISAEVPNIFEQYELRNMGHLFWLKEMYDRGQGSPELHAVVEEGIRRQILPAEGNIAFK